MNRSVADWLGLNRSSAALLVVIGCLGLSEELWSTFVALHLRDQVDELDRARAVVTAVTYVGIFGCAKNFIEGFGYIVGGRLAHRLGPRAALAWSAAPVALGFALMLTGSGPWPIVAGALLITNWEPLSVPSTFDVVGRDVRKERRTIAFALQSIQKRLPKVVGPLLGGMAFAFAGFWLNLTLAIASLALAVVLQLALTRHWVVKEAPARVRWREVLRAMPPELRHLLTAEIFIRWGDWFARDFAVLYVVSTLVGTWGWTDHAAVASAGSLVALTAITALATYIPIAKWVDKSASPRPFIAITFVCFSIFPIALIVLPPACAAAGVPAIVGFVAAYVINGLRELGEPARKALITSGFDAGVRAQGIGLYWGLRSFAFCPAPLVAALLWSWVGPEATFVAGGLVGLAGTAYFVARRQPVQT